MGLGGEIWVFCGKITMLPDLLTTPPPTFTPRQYQIDALAGVENYFRNKLGTHPIVIAPQGSGKSSMIAMLIQRIMKLDRRVICLASDKRLIEQNYKEMQGIWPDAPIGIYCAGLNRKDTQPPIIYATIQSVINNPDALGMFHYAIIDECDLLSPDDDTQYRQYIDYLMGWYPSLRVIGYTATPYRMNQGYLWEGEGALFDGVAHSISIKRLLAEGYLCPLVPYQRKGMDTSKLLIAQGEFDIASQVESLADMLPMIADDIVASFKGDNRKKLLAFTPDVETAIDMACLLSERGLLCDHLTSKRTKDEQSSIIAGFKRGDFPALVSVNMVMRGFNVPDIDCVANVRAMTSPALYEQGAGRGMRIHPSKVNTLYLDYGGNIRRHGVITNVIPPRKRDARQIKMDEELNVWESMRHCDACGRVYEPPFPETCECGELIIVPRKPNVNEYSATADGKDPMKEQPVWHDVEWTRYDRHEKEGGTPSMVVEYNVAGHTYPFKEWICLEHEGFARQKAVQWWQKNALEGTPTPTTVSDALNLVDAGNIPEATKIQVVREGKFWRIMQRVNKIDLGADEGLLL